MSRAPSPRCVLHVDTERGWRGGERQALWLAHALARMGHRSIVAARPAEPLALRAGEASLPVVSCTPAFEADPVAALQLRRVIRREHVDIVHAHTGHAAALGAVATWGTRVPLVVSRRVDFALRRNVGTRIKYGRAAAVIAISRAVADVLARSGIPESRIVVVPDATDVHRVVDPAPPDTLRALGVPLDAPLVVQVAQLVGHKDPLNFLAAMDVVRRDVPNVHAILAGDGPLMPDVRRTVRDLGLELVVSVAGYRTDADALLAAADVVTLSSREEGMGSVLLDALLLGRPIAATRAGGIPEIVQDGVTGLLAPVEDPEALGRAIVRLLSDKPLAERLALGARARARDFSVEHMAERTLGVYERVLAAR